MAEYPASAVCARKEVDAISDSLVQCVLKFSSDDRELGATDRDEGRRDEGLRSSKLDELRRDGASKPTGNEMMVEAFANWGYAGWFMYVVGAVEIASVVAVLIPRIAALGGLWLGALMAGALARISSTPNMSNGSLRESCWGRP